MLLQGRAVHVITVNGYLARRGCGIGWDSTSFLGIEVGADSANDDANSKAEEVRLRYHLWHQQRGGF
ncbi:hypothetical protein [Scytonema sp. UIC 10036]|uniref:hypothetical protein n=1 Tax=Scytonema sp. UIC 10036 TaxID=2304196 RepID=UPI00243211F1|nr:hypothetical protein [Scytonema sp. UIC 10036]